MKINWFSPLPPAKTDVAHYTGRILPALNQFADITLWTDQLEYKKEIEMYGRVRVYDHNSFPWRDLNLAELSIFNIGNHPIFHKSIWQVSQQHPGLVILHDFRLQHLFGGLYKEKYENREDYLTKMKHYYGEDGYQAGKIFWEGGCSTEYMAEHYPLTYLALENALGVIVHSKVTFDTLARKRYWPLAYFPLPYPPTQALKEIKQTIENINRKEPYRLIAFGYLGPNRQLEAILKAIANFPQKTKFRFDIYGHIWDNEFLSNQIKSLKLTEIVFLHGFVPEEMLDSALSKAHLAFNLRYPTMGEASGSQLRIWDHSLPSLVTRTGWYATLPEDIVAFVDPKSPISDIQKHLSAFLNDPVHFQKMGKNGRKKLKAEHHPVSFAKKLINFIQVVKDYRTEALSYKLAERVGSEISCWMDIIKTEEPIQRLAKEIYSLTCKKNNI